MSKNLTIVKVAGQLIDPKYLERVIKNNRVYIGAAIAAEDNIIVSKHRDAPTLEAIDAVQDAFKDQPILFAFGNEDVTEKDMQPFVVMREGDTIKAVVCLDGDFERHRKPEQPMTGEFHAAITIGKYLERFAKNGGIADALEDELNQATFQNLWGSSGSMTFLLSDGYCKTLQSNDKSGTYNWGYTSDAYGYKENVGDTVVKSEPKTLSMADKLKAMLGSTAVKPAEVSQQSEAPEVPADENNAPVTDQSHLVVASDLDLTGAVLVKPDYKDTYKTRKEQKSYYEKRLGYVPQAYKGGPPLVKFPDGTYKLADTKSLATLRGLKQPVEMDNGGDLVKTVTQPQQSQPQPSVNTQASTVTSSAPLSPLEKKKLAIQQGIKEVGGTQSKTAPTNSTIATSALPAQTKDTAPNRVSIDQLPIVSPDMKKKINEVLFKRTEFQGILGENYKEIVDPKRLSDVAAKLPTFAEAFPDQFPGGSMDGFNMWDFNHFLSLAQTDVRASAMVNFWLNVERMRLLHAMQKANASGMKIAI